MQILHILRMQVLEVLCIYHVGCLGGQWSTSCSTCACIGKFFARHLRNLTNIAKEPVGARDDTSSGPEGLGSGVFMDCCPWHLALPTQFLTMFPWCSATAIHWKVTYSVWVPSCALSVVDQAHTAPVPSTCSLGWIKRWKGAHRDERRDEKLWLRLQYDFGLELGPAASREARIASYPTMDTMRKEVA